MHCHTQQEVYFYRVKFAWQKYELFQIILMTLKLETKELFLYIHDPPPRLSQNIQIHLCQSDGTLETELECR